MTSTPNPNPALRFADYLRAQMASRRDASKGELTRLRLLTAAAELFDEIPYHELRMLDVTTRAGLSNGAIYTYFTDKRDLTIALFTDFVRFTQSALLKFPMPSRPDRVLPAIYTLYVRLYANNIGLNAALRHLTVELPEIGSCVEEGYSNWSTQLARFLRNTGRASTFLADGHEAWTIRALSVMAAEFLFDLYARRSPMLAALRDRPEVTGELLASMWTRVCLRLDPAESGEARLAGLTPADVLPELTLVPARPPTPVQPSACPEPKDNATTPSHQDGFRPHPSLNDI